MIQNGGIGKSFFLQGYSILDFFHFIFLSWTGWSVWFIGWSAYPKGTRGANNDAEWLFHFNHTIHPTNELRYTSYNVQYG